MLKRLSVFGDVFHVFQQFLDVFFILVVLVVQVINRLVLLNNLVPVFVVGRFHCLQLAFHLVLILNKTHDVGLLNISLLSQPFNLSGQCTDSVLGGILIGNSFMSFSFKVGFFLDVVCDVTFVLINFLS